MRLIDADRLLSEPMKNKYYHLKNGDTAVPLIDIKHAPTVDAVPVRRGRWIKNEFGSRCACCGMYAYRYENGRPWESDYCPYCGADMRGDKHD